MIKFENLYLIMVGGEGKRLRPFTYALPKPLLTANGISPLEYTIKNIRKMTPKNKIFLSIGYKKNIFKKWIEKKQIKNISFIDEKKPLGTAGVLKKLINYRFKNIIVINGDLFFQTNFKKLINYHIDSKNEATICVKENKISIPYAILKKNKGKMYFKEKPIISYKINTGIYVLQNNFLKKFFNKKKNLKRNSFDMPELINQVKKNYLGVYNIGNKWIDIGNIYDYKKASREIKFW